MFAISQQPALIALSGSPYIFTISSDRVEDFYRVMALPSGLESGDLLPLNSSGRAIFNLQEYFEKYAISEYVTDQVYIHENACKPVTIDFKEYYGNPPEAQNNLQFTGHLLGGSLPRWKQQWFRNNYTSIYQYIVEKKPFLSWHASSKKVLVDQPERLYFLNTLPTQTLKLQLKLYFTDNTIQLLDPNRSVQVDQYKVVSFATGYNALDLANAGKTVEKYDAWISTAAGEVISTVNTYLVDYNSYRNKRFIVFRNSLAGYDILACTGEYDDISEVERNTADRVADVADPDRLNKIEYRKEFFSIVKINTGWLDPLEKQWLNDLFISDDIYELIDGAMNRILIRSKQLDTTDRSFMPGEVEIEYERLFLA